MGIWVRGTTVGAMALVLSVAFVFAWAPPAEAKKPKSIKTEAKWVEFDAAAKTVTVKVRKTGKKSKDKELQIKKGKKATFNVIPDGSIMTRTSVAINGKRGTLTDIPKGKTVNVYWLPDEKNPGKRFAKKIDVIMSAEELEERYGTEDM